MLALTVRELFIKLIKQFCNATKLWIIMVGAFEHKITDSI